MLQLQNIQVTSWYRMSSKCNKMRYVPHDNILVSIWQLFKNYPTPLKVPNKIVFGGWTCFQEMLNHNHTIMKPINKLSCFVLGTVQVVFLTLNIVCYVQGRSEWWQGEWGHFPGRLDLKNDHRGIITPHKFLKIQEFST